MSKNTVKINVESFSKGKIETRNEDYFNYTQTGFVIADWATDKSKKTYNNQTGWEIISRIIVKKSLSTSLNWVELVNYLNQEVEKEYVKLNILENIKDPKYRFSSWFICVRVVEKQVIITYLGDLWFRINGDIVYQEVKQVDRDNATARSLYIQRTGDILGAREHIIQWILSQFNYQNNANDVLWYWVIDWTHTPSKFIKIFTYDREKIHTIELFSDGYFKIPENVSIQAREESFEQVEKEDPDKWKKYKSTKSKDDRTITIIKFS